MIVRKPILSSVALLCLSIASSSQKRVHHYTFYGMDRELMATDSAFLNTPILEGAQVAYSWRQLEPAKDEYDFSLVREDLHYLGSHGKKLFIQIQDVTFDSSRVNVPRYLMNDPQYHGGASRQFRITSGNEDNAEPGGWMARRWDPAVQERLHTLYVALGKEFDGRIEGVNTEETSSEFGESGRLWPAGFSPEIYRDAIITNIKALKRAFPRSVVMVYANFMPGEWRPSDDKGYLRAVYAAARESGIGVGGPDLLPFRPGQLGSSYPLLKESAVRVPVGIAVQDGNFNNTDPETGRLVTIEKLFDFAARYLGVDYIFWGREEPYYSQQVIPFMRGIRH